MKISIAIPVYDMKFGDYFLARLMQSLSMQTFRDYEVVITREGKMAENTNAAIRKSKGDLIKILYMDDYLAKPTSLQEIVDNFTEDISWLATGCIHNDGIYIGNPHYPTFSPLIKTDNGIGSPSVVTIRNKDVIFFDEKLSWLLDAEYYSRLYEKFGEPFLLNTLNIGIGIGPHQMTHILTNEDKLSEHYYVTNKK